MRDPGGQSGGLHEGSIPTEGYNRAVADALHSAPRNTAGPVLALVLLLAAVIVLFLLHLGIGSSQSGQLFALNLTPSEVLRELFSGALSEGDPNSVIVWQIRLPRALACVLVGGLLGTVGSAFQALFRNPLAEPFIVGVSSGAAVGGALAILTGVGALWSGLGLLVCAFLAGLASLALVFGLVGKRGASDVQTLLLAGVVVSSMLMSLLTLLLYMAGKDTDQILLWMLGSTASVNWSRIAPMTATLILGSVILILETKRLNAFAIAEDTARRLGVDTRRLKRNVLITGTAMAAVAVGSVGIIGFLGLVSPHIARRIVGVDWRWSLIASGLVGMALLIPSDVIAQWALPGGEVPVGIVTAMIGAPFLLTLIRKSMA